MDLTMYYNIHVNYNIIQLKVLKIIVKLNCKLNGKLSVTIENCYKSKINTTSNIVQNYFWNSVIYDHCFQIE